MRALAILVAGILLAPIVASAQKPDRDRAGGLPRCEARLADTRTSLDTCTGQLSTCAGDRMTCQADLGACSDDLDSCEADLAACEDSQVVFPGDGAGNGPALAYEECADGLTVADLNTGLLWERKVQGAVSCLRYLHNHSPQCTWAEATGAWIDAVNAEGGGGFAGFSDWRLPNVRELQSIVDYGEAAPALDPSFGPLPLMNPEGCYWSATPVAFFRIGARPFPPGSAWVVCFANGDMQRDLMGSGENHVRAVRTGSCSTP